MTGLPQAVRLKFRAKPGLPKLGWLAVYDRVNRSILVHHGSAVETRPTFFVEGVWDGPFGAGEFAATDCFFGSGAVITSETVVFVSSTSTTDFLFYREATAQLVVSNSLPILLSFLGDELDPTFLGYGPINDSIMKGIKEYIREIPTHNGLVKRLMHLNLEASANSVREIEKPLPPRFVTFEDYHAYLSSKLGRVLANARDPDRTQPMEVLTTQSKGYDTTAINALAAKFGVDQAFTVSKGKGVGFPADRDRNYQVDDDGTEICKCLGIPCAHIERRAFEDRFTYEVELYSALDTNEDANLVELFDRINQVSILLMGTFGSIWDSAEIEGLPMSPDLLRSDLSSHGLGEVRLIVGFVVVAPIYIGARRRDDIHSITESQSMNPWRLRTTYDRPISRRIAEEAGVPRAFFGQTKMASAVEFACPRIPWNSNLRAEYFEFLTIHKLLTAQMIRLLPIIHRINWMLEGHTRNRWITYSEKLISKIIGRNYRFRTPWRKFNGSIFCFCVNRRVRTFKKLWVRADFNDPSSSGITRQHQQM